MANAESNARSILITGCSSGIGRASAHLMLKRGWTVYATARKDQDIAELRGVEGLNVIPLELMDPQSVASCALSFLTAAEGTKLALFNNAAFGQPGAVEDLSAATLREQFEVNVIGTHDLTRQIVPAMRRQGWGRIVNCSSVLGFIGAPMRGAYCASKFALEGLSDALRLELRGTGIDVCLIQPGPIRTRFVDHALAAARRNIDLVGSVHAERYKRMIAAYERGGASSFKLEPESVANKLASACEARRPHGRYKVTIPTHIAGVLKRTLPDAMLDLIVARN